MPRNLVICLDGTGNQFGNDLSNVVKLFRMLERKPEEQVAYYDPGVGTMGDPAYKTWAARKINKTLGLAFGRGLTKNLIEAYTYLMQNYELGDRVFLFGFSRGAYTARALAAFIRECGLFEKGAENLIPYAMNFFLQKPPKDDPKRFYKVLSSFRSTYGRRFRKEDDPKDPRRVKPGDNPYHYQLRLHFMGLFDTVKSYGWVTSPITFRNETENASVLCVRHALAIDERRIFFRQMHWTPSVDQDCKEVWFPGVHSDIGGGYPETESALAKVALEWMVHEACAKGLKVSRYRYGRTLGRMENGTGKWKPTENDPKFPNPDPAGVAHESLKGWWKVIQALPKKLQPWEDSKHRRTIMSEDERLGTANGRNPLLVHESVVKRLKAEKVSTVDGATEKYQPVNLRNELDGCMETTMPADVVLPNEG